MRLTSAVSFAFVLASSAALCWAQNIEQPSTPNTDFVRQLLDEFFNRMQAGRLEQRLRIERSFNSNTADVLRLIQTITISGDIQPIVDASVSNVDVLWQQIRETNRQLFWDSYKLYLVIQRSIEARITPAARQNPLVQRYLADIWNIPRRLSARIDSLWTEKRASFLDDLSELLSAAKRLHAEAVVSNDSSAFQTAFLGLAGRSYDLLWVNLSDYFDQYVQIYENTDKRYKAEALLVVL